MPFLSSKVFLLASNNLVSLFLKTSKFFLFLLASKTDTSIDNEALVKRSIFLSSSSISFCNFFFSLVISSFCSSYIAVGKIASRKRKLYKSWFNLAFSSSALVISISILFFELSDLAKLASRSLISVSYLATVCSKVEISWFITSTANIEGK